MKEIQKYLTSPQVTSLAESTRRSYAQALGHLEKFCERREITKIASIGENLDRFVDSLKHQGLTGQSIQQYITCIKIFLRSSGCPSTYTYKITSYDKKANSLKHLRRWFDENDVAKCLAYDFPNGSEVEALRKRLLIRFLIETGARIRELSDITMEQVDVEEMVLWINQSKTVPRAVFFSPWTQSMLLKFLDLHDGDTEHLKLFPDVRRLMWIVNEMLRNLGLKTQGDGRGAHTFRHYTATKLYYDGGIDLIDLANLMGDKPETIRSTYLHPTPLQLRVRVARAFRWEY